MRKLALSLVMAAALAAFGSDPPPRHVITIFVQGNNRSAYKVRKQLARVRGGKWCIAPALNPATAYAILDVSAPAIPGQWSDRATATLTLRNGNLIWSTSPVFGSDSILSYLNRDVCLAVAKWK